MGYISDKINAKLPRAFDGKLADAVHAFRFTRVEGGDIDPVTGIPTGSSVTINVTGRGPFGSYRASETDGTNILITDTRLTAVQAEVVDQDGLPIAPIVGDVITSEGVSYDVVNVSNTAGATWTLQLRNS
ncbi:glutamate 5-kinase [Modicisalibacter coralii]|uniref:glutamate 5-kinase n=1 Tax=Modicisalibacter coralii TaxID=2304602 RepID=UPI00100AF589|nr:glutamate 5-kinase [Halomonas coralii]